MRDLGCLECGPGPRQKGVAEARDLRVWSGSGEGGGGQTRLWPGGSELMTWLRQRAAAARRVRTWVAELHNCSSCPSELRTLSAPLECAGGGDGESSTSEPSAAMFLHELAPPPGNESTRSNGEQPVDHVSGQLHLARVGTPTPRRSVSSTPRPRHLTDRKLTDFSANGWPTPEGNGN